MIESQSEEQLLRKQLFAFPCSKFLVHSMMNFLKKVFIKYIMGFVIC